MVLPWPFSVDEQIMSAGEGLERQKNQEKDFVLRFFIFCAKVLFPGSRINHQAPEVFCPSLTIKQTNNKEIMTFQLW